MKRRRKQEWARRGPDCSADLVDADLTVSSNPMRSFRIKSDRSRKAQALASHRAQSVTDWGCQKELGPCEKAEADLEGAAAGGWQLPTLPAPEQQVAFSSRHELHTSTGATAFKHFCSKITKSKNNSGDTISQLLKKSVESHSTCFQKLSYDLTWFCNFSSFM